MLSDFMRTSLDLQIVLMCSIEPRLFHENLWLFCPYFVTLRHFMRTHAIFFVRVRAFYVFVRVNPRAFAFLLVIQSALVIGKFP